MLTETTRKVRRALREPSLVRPYLADQLGRTAAAKHEPFYRATLRLKGADLDPQSPAAGRTPSAVLQSVAEYRESMGTLDALGLHRHPDDPKNWDALLALRSIREATDAGGAVLDAGGATYSPLLEWLYLYGYRDLVAYNIDFDRDFSRGPIRYVRGDFTETGFESDRFDVVTTLSVVEHGVDVERAFAEFHRLLRPGGRLVVSTDYWPTGRPSAGTVTEYGDERQSWTLYDADGVADLVATADRVGFEVPDEVETAATDRTVEWQSNEFTYLYLEFDA